MAKLAKARGVSDRLINPVKKLKDVADAEKETKNRLLAPFLNSRVSTSGTIKNNESLSVTQILGTMGDMRSTGFNTASTKSRVVYTQKEINIIFKVMLESIKLSLLQH